MLNEGTYRLLQHLLRSPINATFVTPVQAQSFFHNGFLMFIVSVAIVTIGAPLLQQGVFIDAMLYKTVAHNYAAGGSTLWGMKFTDISMNPFYEQPPLFFFFTATWYRIFGDGLVADRLFTLFCLVATLLLFHRLCRLMFSQNISAVALFFTPVYSRGTLDIRESGN